MGLDNGSRYDEIILIQQPFIKPHRTTLTQIFSLEFIPMIYVLTTVLIFQTFFSRLIKQRYNSITQEKSA